jgi:multimeric flavodoxin WrbA
MKILTIQGSPRRRGNTATVLGWFETLMTKGHEVEHIELAEYRVNGCQHCSQCQSALDVLFCPQGDDAVALFSRMCDSDVIVYATPLYTWGFPSQLKALIDRHICMIKGIATATPESLLKGKRTTLLVTCGGSEQDDADLIQKVFDRFHACTGCSVVGKYVVPFCTEPGDLGSKGMNVAERMARDIGRCTSSGC